MQEIHDNIVIPVSSDPFEIKNSGKKGVKI